MRALARIRGGRDDQGGSEGHLFRSADALMLNTVLSGALGFTFWILAARLYSAERVGINSALIAVMVTVSTLCQVNLGSLFTRFLPEATKPARVIVLGYASAAAFAVVVATAILFIAPRVTKGVAVLGTDRLLSVIWVAAVALWCVFALQDAALTALRFARWVPLENGIFGVLKIGTLILLAGAGVAQGMLYAWVLPMVLLVIPVNLIIFRRAVPAHTPAHGLGIVEGFGRRRLYRYLGFTSIASIFDQGMQAALPLVVIAVLGATQDAYFYIPFTIVMTTELLADNAVTALTVEGSFAAHRVQELTIAVGRRLVLILVPISAILIVAAPLVLLFFGQEYVDHGATVLRLMAAASLFRGAIWVYMGVCRIQGRGSVLLAQSTMSSVGALVLISVFARYWGLTGVGLAWLATNILVAGFVLPMLWRFIRQPRALEAGTVEGRAAVTVSGRSLARVEGHPLHMPPPMMGAVDELDDESPLAKAEGTSDRTDDGAAP